MNPQFKNVFRGLFTGIVMASFVLWIGLSMGSMQGWLVIIWPENSLLSAIWNWVYNNMKESIFVFVFLLTTWIYSLQKLNKALKIKKSMEDISYLEQMVDINASVFFGVGVIYTAIGMRSALMGALGGLDAQSAAEQGAFVMLQRLVDGGILLSLSTTIVGGVGGYIMRIAKSVLIGKKLHEFYICSQKQTESNLIDKLDSIEKHLSVLTANSTNKTRGSD